MKEIWSVGHSTRTIEEFLEIIRFYRIKTVVDVRRFPSSKKFPWFAREELSYALQKEGIEYIWLGDRLGGFRRGGYENYMKKEEFLKGIEELEEIAKLRKTAFLCAEKLPFRCHRRFISRFLQERGWKVYHIIEKGRLYFKHDVSGLFT